MRPDCTPTAVLALATELEARIVLPDDGETNTVELGRTLGGDAAGLHATAVLALATEFW